MTRKNAKKLTLIVFACLVFLSVCLYKILGDYNDDKEQNKRELFCTRLEQVSEQYFSGLEGIKSANAIVSYNQAQEQYKIELSLETDGEIDEEQVELFKYVLRKTYTEINLTINGELR